jgi:hypothetical protein
LKTCGDHDGKITFYKKDEKRKKKKENLSELLYSPISLRSKA